MKINRSNFYTYVFATLLLLQLYLPSFKSNIFIQIGVLGIMLCWSSLSVGKSFVQQLWPMLALFLIGFLGMAINSFAMFNILKDVFHFLKPLLGILLGYLCCRKIGSYQQFVKMLVYTGFLSAIVHFLIILFFSRTETVSDIREFGKDNFLELFSLFFLMYYKRFQGEPLIPEKRKRNLILFFLIFSNVLYFSRTMIVVALILWLGINRKTLITTTTLRAGAIIVLLIGAMYAYLFSVKIERDKNGFESFLYKVKIAPEELFQTRIDRENHAELWDHWRGYESKRAMALMEKNPSSYFFGCGYGSLVNLKFYAPLSDDPKGMKFISELHNGYTYLLYKVGFFGLIVYMGYLFWLYFKIYSDTSFVVRIISAIGLIYIFTTLTITGLYNTKDIIIFILGAMFFFAGRRDLMLPPNDQAASPETT